MFGLERNECASRIDTSFHPIAGKPRVRNCEGGGRGFVLIMSSIFPGAASSAWTGTRGKIEHSHVETACVGRPGQALHLCKARPRPSQRRLSLTARLLGRPRPRAAVERRRHWTTVQRKKSLLQLGIGFDPRSESRADSRRARQHWPLFAILLFFRLAPLLLFLITVVYDPSNLRTGGEHTDKQHRIRARPWCPPVPAGCMILGPSETRVRGRDVRAVWR